MREVLRDIFTEMCQEEQGRALVESECFQIRALVPSESLEGNGIRSSGCVPGELANHSKEDDFLQNLADS